MCTTIVTRLAGTVIRVASIIQRGHRSSITTYSFIQHSIVINITTSITALATATSNMRTATLRSIVMVRIDSAAGLADHAQRGLTAAELIGQIRLIVGLNSEDLTLGLAVQPIAIAVCVVAKLAVVIPAVVLAVTVNAIIIATGRGGVLGPRSLPRAAGVRAVRRADTTAGNHTISSALISRAFALRAVARVVVLIVHVIVRVVLCIGGRREVEATLVSVSRMTGFFVNRINVRVLTM
mmetsp:Transcript_9100/g.15571  ORF Transcript_9100/g.15571 Transcript_9100/m.15571 type:complete len:238 (+) Transcript_9100:1146-1859(+)